MSWRMYLPAARRLRETGLSCVGAGSSRAEPGRPPPMKPRRLGCHALVFVVDGTGWFGTGRDRVTVRAPALLWLFPQVTHAYGPLHRGWTESWVMYEGVATAGYAAYGLNDPQRPVVDVGRPFPPTLHETFEELRTLSGRTGMDAQLLAATLTHRLLGIARAVSRRVDPVARSLVDEITATSAEDLTVADRARRAGVSPTLLRDQVRDETGVTPHELVIRTRVARAQHLLVASELSVTEIARSVGYQDPAYFSRLFTRRVGTSPHAFRQLP